MIKTLKPLRGKWKLYFKEKEVSMVEHACSSSTPEAQKGNFEL